MNAFFRVIVSVVMLTTCVSGPLKIDSLANQTFMITTFDVYAQDAAPRGGKSWQGDWEFRRDRLDIVDSTLRDLRPDIAFFQNSLRRTGSISEDDSLILKAGSLARYNWHDVQFEMMEDSGEERLLAVALQKPLEVAPKDVPGHKALWQIGTDGHVAMTELTEVGDEPILLVNVLMPSRKDQVNLWYAFLQERILEHRKSYGICAQRVIVAGYLPIEGDGKKARSFLTQLQLKDTSAGFCQNAERCQTASSSNGIYALTSSDGSSGHVDKILVHESANVISGGLAFTASRDNEQYKNLYQLSKIWAGQRFGWYSKVRLPKCVAEL